jgi:hypothetical protein
MLDFNSEVWYSVKMSIEILETDWPFIEQHMRLVVFDAELTEEEKVMAAWSVMKFGDSLGFDELRASLTKEEDYEDYYDDDEFIVVDKKTCDKPPSPKIIRYELKISKRESLYGFVSEDGFVVKPKYERVGYFKNGHAIVYFNDKCGYINEKGEELGKGIIYDDAEHFVNGFGMVSKFINDEFLHGFVNKNGEEVFGGVIYRYAHYFENNGVARMVNNDDDGGKWGLINTKGEVLGKGFVYLDINFFRHGTSIVRKKDDEMSPSKYGLINDEGKELGEGCVYDRINRIKGKKSHLKTYPLYVRNNNKSGLMSNKGKILGQGIVYDMIEEIEHKIFSVKKDGKYGYIDWKGRELETDKLILPKKIQKSENNA